ncbi:hypothetical protein ACH5RR_006486 [Cinchona calisaya]|uniref:Flavonoid 3',5'-hydroxylase n=1 Tax=Cinchona calisaya TaxID=153742 RepID=A0ABD3AP50_9GENT
MAKKYGPVIYLKVGTWGMVVASTPEAAKAFLKTQDMNFSNRAPNAGATHLAYNSQDMVFAAYGPRWKLLRKLSNLHMLGGKALDNWANVRMNELGHILREMYESSNRGDPVVLPEMLTYAMANILGQVILSRRVFASVGSESNEFKEMVVELMTIAGYFNIGDFITSIAWMDLQGIEGAMKRLHKRFDALLTKMLEEHKASAHERKERPDLLDFVMENRDNSEGERLSTDNIKALLLGFRTSVSKTRSQLGRTNVLLLRVQRMGVVMVEYILGTLVHAFDWKLPDDVVELNMEESFGLVLQKAVPLKAIVSPRLSVNAYVD